MKTLRNALTAFAVVFAVGGAFASMITQGFYDGNGTDPLGGIQGTIDDNRNCLVQDGTICTIGGQWAFNTKLNAEANQGRQTNPNAVGLLKFK